MNEQRYPKGWDEQSVRELIAYHDSLTEEEQVEEIEAAFEGKGIVRVTVPVELEGEVREFIARRKSA